MIFIQPEYRYLLKNTDPVGEYECGTYSLQEMLVKLHNQVAGKSCQVIGSFSGAPEKVLELLLLCHTIKKEGALKLSLISPYLGYSRQDRNYESQSYGLKWAIDTIAACGVDEIISLDIHNSHFNDIQSLPLQILNISSYALWESYFYQYAQQGYSFVAPDKGAYDRYDFLKKYVWAYFEKKRNEEDVQILGMQGKVYQKVIIVDDILDTGETLLQTCIVLQKLGVVEIIIFVTHGVFSKYLWNELFSLGVTHIYCTDSLPGAALLEHPYIKTVSIRPVLKKYL